MLKPAPEPAPLSHPVYFKLTPDNPLYLANTQGYLNEHLQLIEKRLQVHISNRGNSFTIKGQQALTAQQVVCNIYEEAQNNRPITPELVHLVLVEIINLMANTSSNASAPTSQNLHSKQVDFTSDKLHQVQNINKASNMSIEQTSSSTPSTSEAVQTKRLLIKPRCATQLNYIQSIRSKDINFGIGPAGTGKTYLAVACAIEALEQEKVRRVLLVRPAVEAGEKLGFLPGDLSQKIDPYLRPLYDALYEMLGFDVVERLMSKNIIEVAPLAYMRGRTLNNSFIILDESQNTTKEQMKMFLTRLGFGSTAVITGDATQVDLPKGTHSGLRHAIQVLKNVPEIGMTVFSSKDVIRHHIVQKVVEAYDNYDQNNTDK